MIDPAALGWDDLRAFIEVADRGAATEAAEALGVSAATVARRLQRLEAALGAPLFLRRPNRLDLTPLGRELAEAGSAMRDGATALARRAALHAAARDAPVRVTATGSVSLFLAANARRLSGAATEAGVAMSVVTTRAKLDIAAGEAEIALRMRRLPEVGPLAGRRVGRISFALYAARGRWERLGCSEQDWCRLGIVGLERTSRAPSQSQWLDAVARRRGAEVRLRFGDIALRHRAVQEGAGASLLPCFLGDADDGLLRLAPPPVELTEDVYLLMDDHSRRRPPVRGVADALTALFRDSAEGLTGMRPSGGAEPVAQQPADVCEASSS